MRVAMLGLFCAMALACQSPDAAVVDASTVAPVVTAVPTPTVVTSAAWTRVASKGKVYTDSRRSEAENRVKLSNDPAVSVTLDAMAKQPATPDGIKAASQLARDAQNKLDPASATILDDVGLMVLHGLVATACKEHDDVASGKALLATLREMPLPRRTDAHGFVQQAENERSALDQEMSLAYGDKWAAISANAPPAKRNVL
jgi:hypothetical protein